MRKAHLMLVGLLLSFAANATNDIPRPEYPRPQFERTTWVNLMVRGHMNSILMILGKSVTYLRQRSLAKQLRFLSARKANYPELIIRTL